MRIFHPTVLSVVLILLAWNVRSGRAQLEGNGAAEAPLPPAQVGESPLGSVAPGELISFFETHVHAHRRTQSSGLATSLFHILWVCPFVTPPEGVEFNRMGASFGGMNSTVSFGIYDRRGYAVALSGPISISPDSYLIREVDVSGSLAPSTLYFTAWAWRRNDVDGMIWVRPAVPPNLAISGRVENVVFDGNIPNSFDPADVVNTFDDYPISITLSLVATPTSEPTPTPTPTLTPGPTPGPGGGIGVDSSPWVFNMELVSWLKVEGSAKGLVLEDQRIYLATTDQTNYVVSVIDIRDPAAPNLLGIYSGVGFAGRLDVEDGFVYTTLSEDGMDILDAKNPQAIQRVLNLPDSDARPWQTLRVVNQTVFLSRLDSQAPRVIEIYDVVDPSSPRLISTIENVLSNFDTDGDLLIVREYHPISGGGNDLFYDVSNPSQPMLIAASPSAFSHKRLYLNQPYVVDWSGPFISIYDVSNLQTVDRIAIYQHPGRFEGVPLIDGNTLFAGGSWGVQILDITEPGNPDFMRASYFAPSGVAGLAVDGDLVYVQDAVNGLIVLRILDGATPMPTPEPRPDAVQVLAPNGGEVLMTGDFLSIQWRTDVPEAGTGVRFELRDSRGRVAKLGYGWNPLGEDVDEVYVPLVPTGDDYRVRVISTWNEELFDDSDAPFMISRDPVLVVEPNGGEVWEALSRGRIHWKNNRLVAGTAVFFELHDDLGKVADLGTAWDSDAEDVTEVIVPLVPVGSDYRVRVISAWDSTLSDESDAPFRIIGGPRTGESGGSEAGEASVDPASWEVYE